MYKLLFPYLMEYSAAKNSKMYYQNNGVLRHTSKRRNLFTLNRVTKRARTAAYTGRTLKEGYPVCAASQRASMRSKGQSLCLDKSDGFVLLLAQLWNIYGKHGMVAPVTGGRQTLGDWVLQNHQQRLRRAFRLAGQCEHIRTNDTAMPSMAQHRG